MKLLLFIIGLTCLIFPKIQGQFQETAPDTYILYLKDKKHNDYQLNQPEKFLTNLSISRRLRQGIILDSTDLPVSKYYLDSLSKTGLVPFNISHWQNAITFKTKSTELLAKLGSISFVQTVLPVSKLRLLTNEKLEPAEVDLSWTDTSFYGKSYKQIHMHHGEILHQLGLRGENMLIGVIDAGFYNYQSTSGFQNLLNGNRIKGIRDFVAHDGEVNLDHYHGAHVLSILTGYLEQQYMGSAPMADYLLIRSEEAASEYITEEDNWVAAAEYADSLGCDIITTSLGYTTFTNADQDHTYQDMDGATTRISQAAELAAQKGILVVVSAGNEGSGSWRYISAPADARDVLAVGAVNLNQTRANFSSQGPAYDNRIKPDVMATGQGTYLQTTDGSIIQGSGTSYAAPIIAGLTACLWQGAPQKTNFEIMDAIRKCSDNYQTPDNYYGYGIPDFKKALLMLNPATYYQHEDIWVYPNPFLSDFTIQYPALPGNKIKLRIFNVSGQRIFENDFSIEEGTIGEITVSAGSQLPKGVLILQIQAGGAIFTKSIVKL